MAITPSSYVDLDLHIFARQGDRYRVDLSISSPKYGPISGTLEDSELYVDGERRRWMPSDSPEKEGERLFAWLFADQELRDHWIQVRGRHPQRRVRLLIDPDAPEMHAIPWELLRDASESGNVQVLGATVATPFSRYLAGGWEPAHPVRSLPLKILVAIANPEGLKCYQVEPVDFEREWSNVQAGTAALASAKALELVPVPPPVTLGRIEAELKKGYHVLHLVAHGKYPQKPASGQDQASLFLADENNDVKRVTETELAGMLGRQIAHAEATGKPDLRLVFLASCETAKRSDADAFRGMAPRLVQGSLPAVLAMQDAVEMEAAREFSRVFYRQLLSHGQVDLACNEARSALLTGGFQGAYIPVLFSRLPGNVLLDPSILRKPWRPLEFEPEVIYVRSGKFFMGGSPHDPHVKDWETQADWIDLAAFCIGKYPVTNGQYWAFVKASGHDAPQVNWAGRRPRKTKLDHPVVGVSWYDACAYCAWLSEQTGRRYRLPSEAEWEKAARGMDDQRIYPWGDTWQPDRCNHDQDETTDVGAFGPQSPFGCYDMVGNAREWTTTIWGGNSHEAHSDFPYPWKRDGRDTLGQDPQLDTRYRICRGGSYAEGSPRLRCSERDWYSPDAGNRKTGFRVVMEIG
jgi:formylglycine-generating enzyme required for sulfatase activity